VSYYQQALLYFEHVFCGRHHPSQAQLKAQLRMADATVNVPAELENCYQQIVASMKVCFSNSPKMWVSF
jgi:hypothetical protein